MKNCNDWDDIGACYNNATILRKAGMPEAAESWTDRANELMGGATSGRSEFEELLRSTPQGRA